MTKTYCDYCHKEGRTFRGEFPACGCVDLCQDCESKIFEIIKAGKTEQEKASEGLFLTSTERALFIIGEKLTECIDVLRRIDYNLETMDNQN